jgi:hypothetical protein
VSLAALGVKEHDMGLESVDRAEIEVSGRARLESDAVHLSGRARVSDVSLFERKLSNEVVRAPAGYQRRRDVSPMRASTLNVEVEGKVKPSRPATRSEAKATRRAPAPQIPLAACSDMLASIPAGLVPLSPDSNVGAFAFSEI